MDQSAMQGLKSFEYEYYRSLWDERDLGPIGKDHQHASGSDELCGVQAAGQAEEGSWGRAGRWLITLPL